MKNIKSLVVFLIVTLINAPVFAGVFAVKLSPRPSLMTAEIQAAIDSCAANGGGEVIFSAGTFLCGGIELKSKVSLFLEKGSILQGSDKYADYQNDAFIFGKDLSEVGIRGEGTIDGVDCYNPKGEEGFRGPHCIRFIRCTNITLEGFTIQKSANWAINCRYCSNGKVDKVSIRGGHDGLHTRFCSNFKVSDCDFRTGDDAFAGNDNRDFVITGCKINTSCNGFRMGCNNLIVKDCHFWGPGESPHLKQSRNNMLSAFVHFSPKDDNSKLESGNWLIENITVENVDQFYVYNFKDGLWQTGQPVTNIHFKNINAAGILGAYNIIGDLDLKFNLKVENSSFTFREGADYAGGKFEGATLQSPALFNATNFETIELYNVTFTKDTAEPVLNCFSGISLTFENVNFKNSRIASPFLVEDVEEFNP